jgi:hypothetical protein
VEFGHDRRLVAPLFHGGPEAPVGRQHRERSGALLGVREVDEADLVVELEDGVAEIVGLRGMQFVEEVAEQCDVSASANPALYQVAVEFSGPPHEHRRTWPAR